MFGLNLDRENRNHDSSLVVSSQADYRKYFDQATIDAFFQILSN
jgi:hypothetical protein